MAAGVDAVEAGEMLLIGTARYASIEVQNGEMLEMRQPVGKEERAREPEVVKLRAFWTKLTKTSVDDQRIHAT